MDKLEANTMKPVIVLKIGSSTLTAGTSRISRGKMEDIARQIEQLRTQYHIVLVSSGAVATARQFIDPKSWGDQVASKQALSAIGQPKLMQMYSEVFSDFDIRIAQCLMTYIDFEKEQSRNNTLNTIRELLNHQYLPIINENDTVAVEELIVGDNDKLSALVARLLGAKYLVLASDIDGLYDKNPHLHQDAKLLTNIRNFEDLEQYIEERKDTIGTGGMTSKVLAAKICTEEQVKVIIVNGGRNNFLVDCLNKAIPHTEFI
ncbi:MAG: glutamate 5-kinase [Bacteroidota bacterium]